jgi:predicted cobalt transporter CbtA
VVGSAVADWVVGIEYLSMLNAAIASNKTKTNPAKYLFWGLEGFNFPSSWLAHYSFLRASELRPHGFYANVII